MKSSREEIDTSPFLRNWFSPAIASLHRRLLPTLRLRARGDLLDAGCGAMPYRPKLESNVTSYDGMDLLPRTRGVRYVCSITDMDPIRTNSYDTILCSEVLEHVDNPKAAVAEFARVLRPGGTAIITVPFLSRLHEEPHDYQRFTEHGLRELVWGAGLDVQSIETTGSIFSFLGHQVSSAVVLPVWQVPILKWVVFAANMLLIVLPAMAIDALLKPVLRKLPLGYVVVASAPQDT